jgi:hypothetical protein
MAQLNFNAQQVAPAQPFGDPLPEAWYVMTITKSETMPVKDKPSEGYLQLEFTVAQGPMQGRKATHRLNLYNANQQAVDIAYGELSAICHATGVIQVQDSQQLHNIPLGVKLGIRPAEGQYSAQNTFKGFKRASEVDSTPAAAPSAPPGGFAQPAQQQQPGFAPPAGAPAGGFAPAAQPGFAPPAQTGFAAAPPQAPQGPQGGFAPAAGQTPGPGMFQQPANAPQGGFAPQGAAPQQQQPGFATQGGFAPPGGPATPGATPGWAQPR